MHVLEAIAASLSTSPMAFNPTEVSHRDGDPSP